MIWFLTALVAAAGVAGWYAGVWWGRRVGDDQPDRWYADDPNSERP